MEENKKMNKICMDKIRVEFEASPMYNMSLSSKELFHSNMLAWLGNNKKTKSIFVKIVEKLAEVELKPNDSWTVEREDKNFDLCIKKGEEYILVIENKVKSIPRKAQLDEYVKKIEDYYKSKGHNTKFLLLTLANTFPHKTDIEKEDVWKIKTYEDLADAIDMNLLDEEYHKQLIDDYRGFITNLDALAEKWQEGKSFAYTGDLEGFNKLFDLHAKIQFSLYCVKLKDRVAAISSDIVVFDNNDKIESTNKNKLYIMVDWGFASRGKTGLLDISIPVTDHNNPHVRYGCCKFNHVVKIQVEGRSYRHVLESLDKPQDLVSNGIGDPYINKLKWFSKDPSYNSSGVNYGNKDIFKDDILYPESKQSLRNKDGWPFKSYNNKAGKISFIYQSKNIIETAAVDDVLQNIVDEIKRVLAIFK